jgi:hypothetical protein
MMSSEAKMLRTRSHSKNFPSHFTGKELVKELLMELSEYMRMQWGTFLIQNCRQNITTLAEWVNAMDKIVSVVEIS